MSMFVFVLNPNIITDSANLLTLSDAGFWEVSFLEKWSLSYQIFFQMKI